MDLQMSLHRAYHGRERHHHSRPRACRALGGRRAAGPQITILAGTNMPDLALRPITRDTLRPLFRLKVRDDQQGLVAPNEITLAQAPYETGSYVWGLWDGETAVGLMAMVHPAEYPWHEPGDDREAAYLWRLLIGADHQGRGYGRAAIGLAVGVARGWGTPRLTLSVVDAPHSNIGFYERLEFRRTGHLMDGEIVMGMDV
jgi:diamine N-acetyltransferase